MSFREIWQNITDKINDAHKNLREFSIRHKIVPFQRLSEEQTVSYQKMAYMVTLHNYRRNLNIWWFPQNFCQSRFGPHAKSGLNSCTLISLILLNNLSEKNDGYFYRTINKMPRCIVDVLGMAINKGNELYKNCLSCQVKKTLSIPDGMRILNMEKSVNFNLKEWFYTHFETNLKCKPKSKIAYCHIIALRLNHLFKRVTELYQAESSKSKQPLFIMLITNYRTVTFVFDFVARMIAFYDSHQHGKRGAVVVQCKINYLYELIVWFIQMLDEVYQNTPKLFEISFLSNDDEMLPKPEFVVDNI